MIGGGWRVAPARALSKRPGDGMMLRPRPPRRTRLAGLVATLLLVITTAACGTTVPLSARGSNGGSGAGLGAPAGGGGGATGALDAGSGTSATTTNGATGTYGQSVANAGGGPAGQSPTGGPGISAASPRGSAGTVAGGRVSGVTATTVSLGYIYTETSPFAAFNSTIGGGQDVPGTFNALAADLNRHGGLLGHRVLMVGYQESSAETTGNSEGTEQSACSFLTVDHPVFAVLSFFGATLTPCLTKHGVYQIAAPEPYEPGWADTAYLKQCLCYAPAGALDEIYESTFVSRLVAQGYFSRWDTLNARPGNAPVKVGLLSFSDPGFANQAQALLHALAEHGIVVSPGDDIEYPAAVNDQSAALSDAELKFRSDGVTHVLGVAANGLATKQFSSQRYYPRYGLDSMNVLAQTAQLNQGTPALNGAMGVGLIPTSDVDATHDPGPVSSQQTRCQDLARAAGITDWTSNRNSQFTVLSVCEAFWSVTAALQRGGELTPQALAAGYAQLGSVPSVMTFGESWAGGRLASASVVDDIRYYQPCSCFAYTGVKTSF